MRLESDHLGTTRARNRSTRRIKTRTHDSVKIRISWKKSQVTATLAETPTSSRLKTSLPFDAKAQTWGKEVYFRVPFTADLEPDAKQVVEPGTVCYWVEGQSMAIPFGPTPISKGNECRLVAPVNILGRLDSDARILDSVEEGDSIRVEEA